jgi:hypothetical protein
MMEVIGAILGSGPIGALVGGVLGYFNRKIDLQAKQIDAQLERDRWAHQAAMRQVDLEQTKAESDGMRAVKQIEADGMVEAARMQAIAQAQAADRPSADVFAQAGGWGRGVLVFVTALQSVIRPLLTVALIGAALWLNLELLMLLRGQTWVKLAPTEQRDLALEALRWTMAQASMAASYWFVSRGTGK